MTRLLDTLFASLGLTLGAPLLLLLTARETLGVFNARPGITGLAQVQSIDMSTPDKLAQVDAQMLRTLTLRDYFRYILQTVTGKGQGDRVVP